MTREHLFNIALMVITSLLASALIMPFMMKIAHHIGAVDVPRTTEGNRHIHKKPIPKLGGVGIFLGFLVGYMIFGQQNIIMNSILIASFIIIIYGIIDDIKTLQARYELVGQLLAALVITLYGGILLQDITIFGHYINFGIFAYPITIFFILGCTNVIRLIDGLDGLSSGISSIFYLTIGIIAFFQGRVETLEIILSFIMLGATLGFLLHNFNPAKLFAGESGSAFMGFMIAVISLLGFKGTLLTSLIVPLSIIAIPILDTLFAIIRRMIKGQPIFQADKDHLHHQFLKMNFSQRKTVLIIYFIDALFSLVSIFYALQNSIAAMIIYCVLMVLVFWFVLHTSIISERLKNKVDKIEETAKHKIKK